MRRRTILTGAIGAVAAGILADYQATPAHAASKEVFPVNKTEAEWRKLLTKDQYHVLREEGTEPSGSSPLNAEKRAGTFACAACDQPLFSSETKYESGTGWPSFYAPIEGAVGTSRDFKLFLPRTEVHCSNCGGHLGHVFNDGPPPTGKRYCMNGIAMTFKPVAGEAPPKS